jgi:tetratricopeptide (TPR) repeat protein
VASPHGSGLARIPARYFPLLAGTLLAAASPSPATTADGQIEQKAVSLSADQLLALAERARDTGDITLAEAAYRALLDNPSMELRNEARFRLAMLYVRLHRLPEAAILLRQILDQQPNAQRVRLELARVLDLLGDEAGARRALREAQAGGLPPEVARLVDHYSAALRAQKPLGASLEFALAPDSNINRATRSDTLGTVLGDFTLHEDARQRSGIGISLRGQAYGRLPIGERTNLLARISGAGDLYRDTMFNDVSLGIAAGPEFRLGSDRLTVEGGATWRWYGNKPFSTMTSATLSYLHPMGRKAQLRTIGTLGVVNNRRNPFQDGMSYSLSLSYEQALSSRAGLGGSLAGDRQDLRDPGYATAGGQLNLWGYREVGAATLIGTISYGRIEADKRQLIFPRRRVDDLYRTSLAMTFRRLRIGQLSPFVRVTAERNRSSIELYDYRRVRTEFGLTRAF